MTDQKCQFVHYSRFELNSIRFIIRYGIGLLEGTNWVLNETSKSKDLVENKEKKDFKT